MRQQGKGNENVQRAPPEKDCVLNESREDKEIMKYGFEIPGTFKGKELRSLAIGENERKTSSKQPRQPRES